MTKMPSGTVLLFMGSPPIPQTKEAARVRGGARRRARWSLLAPGPLYASLAGVAIAVVVVCGVNAASRLGEPFPGFFLWNNLFVPAVGESHWSGASAGVHYHSWLLAIDGTPVASSEAVDAALRGRRPGEAVRYRFVKDDSEYEVAVEVMRLGPRAWLSVLGIYTFNALVLIALAMTVLYMKPRDAAARALFLFAGNLALYMATSVDSSGPYWFRVPYFYFVNFVPVTVWNLLSRFPVERLRAPWEDRALAIVAGVAILHATASNAAFHADHASLLQLETVSHGLMAVSGLSAIAFFLWHFLAARTRTTRDRTKIVLFGTLGAFTPPVILLALVYGAGVELPFNFLTMLFVIFPLSIGYAIAKHDLFDIDRAIKRTLVYAAISALVLAVYTAAINVIDIAFENAAPIASRIAEALLILTLIVATNPSRRRIQDVVDRLYDRRRYEYRDVLRAAAQTFTRILDFEQLMERVLGLLDETMQPTLARIHLLGDASKPILHGELVHDPGESSAVKTDPRGSVDEAMTGVFAALETRDVVTAEDDLGNRAEEAAAAGARALRRRNGTIAVPMRLSGALTGALVVGERRAGGHFSGDDVELLRTLADQLAVALENARAYRTIDDLNRDLAGKNVALEGANRELREAQDELVKQERLAAVGEMSSAVAHAIRNPLAGIKAAAQLALFEIEDGEAAESVRDVISETDRLDDRIGALLAFSRPYQPEARPMELRSVVDEALRDTRPKADINGVQIEEAFDEEPVTANVDPVLFSQALLELISNSIDACPEHGRVRVSIGRDGDDGSAWVQVEDNGPGLTEHAGERMFELFYTTKSKGTGFGLATVRKIVERHGGTIVTGSSQLGGALFRIRIPAPASA